jgi:hypothetical protein
MDPSSELLTPEECAQVDAALLTSRDKFTVRVAIYALRLLKQIATETERPIAAIDPPTIALWISSDPNLQKGLDDPFQDFWIQLVIAALKPLTQATQIAGVSLEDLQVPQVIQWFEQVAKQDLQQD